MKIDIFSHITPVRYFETLKHKVPHGWYQDKVVNAYPTLTNLDRRFQIMDRHKDYVQILTVASPAIETVVAPKDAAELAKIANDEMAELIARYPERFVAAVACLPMNDIDAALKETDRALNELRFRGIQIYTNICGKPLDSPEFMPLYEKMTYYDLPIWLHPQRERTTMPDYPGEDGSKYFVFSTLGWPYETSVTMARLVYSGVLEKYPNLKIITHHCGGMVPYFSQRIGAHSDSHEYQMHERSQHLSKRRLDYFRMFYNDTAINGNTPALMCAYAFFGADHILFGTDFPYDNQIGDRSARETIRSVEEMDIPDNDKEKIFADNARKIMRLPI